MPNNSNYVWGIAFVTEGPTEETFYRLYLEYLCVGLSVDFSFGIEHDCSCYQLEGSKGKGIVFF